MTKLIVNINVKNLDKAIQIYTDALGFRLTRRLFDENVAEGEIRKFAWGEVAGMCDPFGNGFCLIQFSKERYDAA